MGTPSGHRWVVAQPPPPPAMKVKIRNSNRKKARKVGFRTRQKTHGGRKVNARQRRRHGRI